MKTLNPKDLPEDRLTTTDESGFRVYLYPAEVKGYFKNLRVKLRAFLIIFFLVLPWIKIQGHQALLLDIPNRRFAFFGLTFWAHDGPMIFFVFISLFLSLAFLTTLLGRVWCGWACPQTVFIEGVFRRIERWVEGDSVVRKKMDQGPWTYSKIIKKFIKWLLFIAASLVITHSFLAYFVGTDRLLQMIQSSPSENMTPFLVMSIATAIVLFDFGWFREQFCVIACPYGRFQSVFLDSNSLSVVYDEARGEPRKGLVNPGQKEGDCVNCFRCVQVCPTGIDIRRGLQMECVACTACIDACDDVMQRLEKPKGLICYDSYGHLKKNQPIRWIRARTIAYALVLTVVFSAFAYALTHRKPIEVMLLRAKESPYQVIEEANQTYVINHFRLELSNKTFEDGKLLISLADEMTEKQVSVISALNPVPLEAGKNSRADFFIKFPKTLLKAGRTEIKILLKPDHETQNIKSFTQVAPLIGPFQ